MQKFTIYLSLLLFSLGSCVSENEEELFPDSTTFTCDSNAPDQVFTSEVLPILEQNCTFSGCHGDNAVKFDLRDYCEAVEAAEGVLSAAINQSSGATPMPIGGNKLAQSDIDIIDAWIESL